jgi:hypothetical protein
MTALTYEKIDDAVLHTLSPPGRGYWVTVGVLFLGILMGAGCWAYQILGIGVAGQNNPVHWGTYLINFVFWVGIAHSGTLISAILHLFRAGWRNPIARAAETMTVFAVCTAGLYPFIHLGGSGWSTTCCPSQSAHPVAQFPVAADVRRGGHQHLPDGQFPVLVHGHAARSGHYPGPRQRSSAQNIQGALHGLDRRIRAVATLHPRLSLFCRPGHAPGHLGPQRGFLGLCPGCGARLAHHDFRPLFCGRCHPLAAWPWC